MGRNKVRSLVKQFEESLEKGEEPYFDLYQFEILIRYYLSKNNKIGSKKILTLAKTVFPFAIEIDYLESIYYLKLKNFKLALQIAENCCLKEPLSAKNHIFKARVYKNMANIPAALTSYKNAVAVYENGDDRGIFFTMSELALEVGESALAIKYQEQGLWSFPSYDDEFFFYLDICKKEKCLDRYDRFLDKILSKQTFSAMLWYLRARGVFENNKYEKALEYIEYALIHGEKNTEIQLFTARVRTELGQGLQAAEKLEEIAPKLRFIQEFLDAAEIFTKLENYPFALKYFNKAFEIDADNYDVLLGLGKTLWKMGRYSESIIHFRQIIQYLPSNVSTLFALAKNEYALGNVKTGITYFKKCLELSPYEEKIIIQYSVILNEEFGIEATKEFLSNKIDFLHITIPGISFLWSYLYLQNKMYDKAFQYYHEGINTTPKKDVVTFNKMAPEVMKKLNEQFGQNTNT